ncbi:uncharacterized protein [Rutidosis leptorrhynchoides]|uniref:uncharacterized protein n=1 Tax=Rutidosis leptorrhynchoides TaxID=125765 RepID=UPI003A99F83C
MKILSLNIRGFGDDPKGKWGWVRELIHNQQPDIVLLQETKLKVTTDFWMKYIWGSNNFSYVVKNAIGKSGGIITIWNNSVFNFAQAVEKNHFLAIKGNWVGQSISTVIINVYGPHSDIKKKSMWDELNKIMELNNVAWVVGGDFNEVRFITERRNSNFIEHRAKLFNEFIDSNKLIEIPMGGKM